MAQKTLLLTGASRGIGHATVRRFNREGWRVITCSRHPFPAECPWGGGADNHVQIDLGDPKDTMRAVADIKSRLGGRLDALVNNAGISPKGREGERRLHHGVLPSRRTTRARAATRASAPESSGSAPSRARP